MRLFTENLLDVIASLHHEPSLMPVTHQEKMMRIIFAMTVVVTMLYWVMVNSLRLFVSKKDTKTFQTKEEIYQTSYQGTNMAVNLFLGVYGNYHMLHTVPKMASLGIIQRIAGFDQYSSFGALQIGYNLWALPTGIFLVKESKAMLAHHVAVILVSALSAFCTNGFRYHAVFFFGAIEISSVPLAIMNFLKKNSTWTKADIPKFNMMNKYCFALTFLLFRVILWTPKIFDVLLNSGVLFVTCDSSLCYAAVGTFWVGSLFLTLLQYYWGWMIVQSLISTVTGKPKHAK